MFLERLENVAFSRYGYLQAKKTGKKNHFGGTKIANMLVRHACVEVVCNAVRDYRNSEEPRRSLGRPFPLSHSVNIQRTSRIFRFLFPPELT